MSFEPLVLDALPGSEIAGIAALAGVVVLASFSLNYAMLRLVLAVLAAHQVEQQVREKEAEAQKAAAMLAAEVLRDRRTG